MENVIYYVIRVDEEDNLIGKMHKGTYDNCKQFFDNCKSKDGLLILSSNELYSQF